MLGFTSSITFYAMAAAFALGAHLVEKNLFGMTFENIMLVFSCIIFGAQSVGKVYFFKRKYIKFFSSLIDLNNFLISLF